MSVGRICTRYVDLADADETAQVAARRMSERRVGALVILDLADRPVGILTDRDLVLRVVANGRDPRQTPVGEVMTENPTMISEAAGIEEALSLMRSGSFRRLPVIGRDGVLVGLVSLDDILSLLAGEFTQVGALVENEMRCFTETTRPHARLAF
ncbi:MAG: CBS domain-containing protein [Isosphaerales bacterium]